MSSNSGLLLVTAAASSLSTLALLAAGWHWWEQQQQQRRRGHGGAWTDPELPDPELPDVLRVVGHWHELPAWSKLPDALEAWAEAWAVPAGAFGIDLAGRRCIVVASEPRVREVLRQRSRLAERPLRSLAPGTRMDAARPRHRPRGPTPSRRDCRILVHRLIEKWSRASRNRLPVRIGNDCSTLVLEATRQLRRDHDCDGESSSDEAIEAGAMDDSVASPSHSSMRLGLQDWDISVIRSMLDGLAWSLQRTATVWEQRAPKLHVPHQTRGLYQRPVEEPDSSHCLRNNGATCSYEETDADPAAAKMLVTAMYILAREPDLQRLLRREADSIRIEDLFQQDVPDKIPHMASFLHEVHRCFAAPIKVLQVVETMPFGPTLLPRGQDMIVLTRYIAHRANLVPMGPRASPPTAFDASRYLVAADGGMGYSFVPPDWEMGGMVSWGGSDVHATSMVETLSYVTLVTALQNLSWRLLPDQPPVSFILDEVMEPDREIELLFKRRYLC